MLCWFLVPVLLSLYGTKKTKPISTSSLICAKAVTGGGGRRRTLFVTEERMPPRMGANKSLY